MAERPTQWAVTDTGTDAALAATKSGITDFRHYITGISISGSAAPAAAVVVQVLNGATPVDQFIIPPGAFSPIVINYDHPLRCADGADAEVTVEAMGSGVVSHAVIRGFTVKGG